MNREGKVLIGILVVLAMVVVFFLARATAPSATVVTPAPAEVETEPTPAMSLASLAGIEPTPDPEEEMPFEAIFNGVAYADVYGFEVAGGCGVRYGDEQFFVMTNGQSREVVDSGQSFVFGCEQGEFFLRPANSEEVVLATTPTPVVEVAAAVGTPVPSGTPAPTLITQPTVATEESTNFTITGALDRVESVNVLQANFDPFVNTIGLGSEIILAEPGVLLTHDATEAEIQAANGAIDRFSSLTQIVLNNPESTQTGCGEGRFVWATGNVMRVSIEDVEVFLPGEEGRNWFFVARCRFSDEQVDTDAGHEMTFSDYVPGFAQVMLMPAGAFISEEVFLQAVPISTGNYSCGSEGCSRLSVFFLDVNTDAWSVLEYTVDNGWSHVADNWKPE